MGPLTLRREGYAGGAHRRMTQIKSACAFGHKKPPPVGAVGRKWRVGCPATGTGPFAVSRDQPAAEPRLAIMVLRARKVAGKPTVVIAILGTFVVPAYCPGDRSKSRCSTEEPRRAPPGWLEGGGTSSSPPRAFGATAFSCAGGSPGVEGLRSRLDHPAVASSRLIPTLQTFIDFRVRGSPVLELQGSPQRPERPMTAVTPRNDPGHPAMYVESAENERFHDRPPDGVWESWSPASRSRSGSRESGVRPKWNGAAFAAPTPDSKTLDRLLDSWTPETPRRSSAGGAGATASPRRCGSPRS